MGNKVIDLNLKIFSSLCAPEEFFINGIEADYDDFGTLDDLDPENADVYSCGNRKFIPKLPSEDVMEKLLKLSKKLEKFHTIRI